MPIQGPAYIKTSWAFEERPVASAKLNTWDDRIEAALELLFFLVHQSLGGGDGVLGGATPDDLAVEPSSTPDMRVLVQPGYAFIGPMPFKLAAATPTPVFSAPVSFDRIDLVQAALDGWSITVKSGIEAGSPLAPPPDAGCLVLAEVYLRPGMGSIQPSDDSTNGYITDMRVFL